MQAPLRCDHPTCCKKQVAENVTQSAVDRRNAHHVRLHRRTGSVRNACENAAEKRVRDDLVNCATTEQVPEAVDVLPEVRSLRLLFFDEEPGHTAPVSSTPA
ncbi:hypothetical protein ON010_g14196 [Phytophthora cinnamomi]|nr:hypothetical protein ON010_g14196 [Phytophthora cinnamomi]